MPLFTQLGQHVLGMVKGRACFWWLVLLRLLERGRVWGYVHSMTVMLSMTVILCIAGRLMLYWCGLWYAKTLRRRYRMHTGINPLLKVLHDNIILCYKKVSRVCRCLSAHAPAIKQQLCEGCTAHISMMLCRSYKSRGRRSETRTDFAVAVAYVEGGVPVLSPTRRACRVPQLLCDAGRFCQTNIFL